MSALDGIDPLLLFVLVYGLGAGTSWACCVLWQAVKDLWRGL